MRQTEASDKHEHLIDWPPLPTGRVITKRDALSPYETPERGAPGHTEAVLVPGSEDEVGQVLEFCSEHRQPLVISAGRTGLVEAQRPDGEAVLSLERLKHPLALLLADGQHFQFGSEGDQAAALFAWWQEAGTPKLDGASLEVEAGMAVDAVNELIEGLGLVWPMELGSSSAASVGGCVANASAGANAIAYGTAVHLCEQAWGFWADGSPAGPFTGPQWTLPATDTLAIDSTRVEPELGLIGSQGLYGVITRARLRLHKIPAAREGVLVPVDDMPAAMRLLAAAQEAFPGAVEEYEFIGRPALECVLDFLGGSVGLPFPVERMRDWCVLLQVESDDADGLAERLYEFLAGPAAVADEDIGYAPLPVLKQIRHSITESSNARMKTAGGGRLSFDTAVPRARFGAYLNTLAKNLRAEFPGVELIAFGHAGVGGAHLHLIGSRETPVAEWHDAMVARVFDVTGEHGGTFSAEHGVGPKWAGEYRQRCRPGEFDRLRDEKYRRDPAGILNPRSFGLLATHAAA